MPDHRLPLESMHHVVDLRVDVVADRNECRVDRRVVLVLVQDVNGRDSTFAFLVEELLGQFGALNRNGTQICTTGLAPTA